jgi:hypothetical protein
LLPLAVVVVDQRARIEAEDLGVGTDVQLAEGRTGQRIELVLFQRFQIAQLDLGRPRDFLDRGIATLALVAELFAETGHASPGASGPPGTRVRHGRAGEPERASGNVSLGPRADGFKILGTDSRRALDDQPFLGVRGSQHLLSLGRSRSETYTKRPSRPKL